MYQISAGNVFEQTGAWRSRWLVQAVVERPGFPTHARLISLDGRQETKLISVEALQDRAKFFPVANQTPAAAE